MKHIVQHDGIAFVIIRFSAMDDIYLMSSEQLSFYWKRMKEGGRKSITLQEVESSSRKITLGFQPRIDYIKVVDSLISENF